MSGRLVGRVLDHSSAQGSPRLVLVVLAEEVRDGADRCWPGIERIARRARLSPRAVQRAIAELRALGELEVIVHGAPTEERPRQYRSNAYRVLVSDDRSVTTRHDAGVTTRDDGDGTTAGGPVVTLVTSSGGAGGSPVVTPASPKPVVNRKRTVTRPSAPSEPRREQGAQPLFDDANATRPPRRDRAPDPLFESVATVCGINWRGELTSSARGALNRAVGELRELDPVPSPAEVGRRAEQYRSGFPGARLTPSALVKHWPTLALPALNGAAAPGSSAREDPNYVDRSIWDT